MRNPVRSVSAPPLAGAFQDYQGTPILIDRVTAKAYILDSNGVVRCIGTMPGGGGTVSSVNQSLAKDDTETLSGGPVTGSGTLARTAVDAGSDKLIFWDDSADKKTYLTVGSGLSISGTTITGTGGSSSLEVDVSAITSGTAGRVLFESATNKLSEDSGFSYSASANVLTVGDLAIAQTGVISNSPLAGTSITLSAGRLGINATVEGASGTDDGGDITITAGVGGSTSGLGGDIALSAGATIDGENGGTAILAGGDAFGSTFSGGPVILIPGKAFGGGGGLYGNFQVKNIDNTHILTYDPNNGILTSEKFQPTTNYLSVDGSTGATGTATAANTLTIKNGLITNIA